MMKSLLLILVTLLPMVNAFGQNALMNAVKFASSSQAQTLLSQEDDFTQSWSQFDIDSRLAKSGGTKEELLTYIKSQTLEWNKKDMSRLSEALKKIDKRLSALKIDLELPDELWFIKTTAKEEGEATAYTRSNYIVFKSDSDKMKKGLESLILHELFHVLSRNNPAFKKQMYAIIGFEIMNTIEYPESIQSLRITNPDAPQTDSYITLSIDDEPVDCMMILYADKPYAGGKFFEYLKTGFLKLEGDQIKTVYEENDQPNIYEYGQVTGFFEQVGNNTKYIIHPEEIMADNFSFAITGKKGLDNPEIPEKILAYLRSQ